MKKSSHEIERRTRGRDTITIENFDLNKAATGTNGYLGIKLPNFVTLTADALDGLDLFGRMSCEAANDLEWRIAV